MQDAENIQKVRHFVPTSRIFSRRLQSCKLQPAARSHWKFKKELNIKLSGRKIRKKKEKTGQIQIDVQYCVLHKTYCVRAIMTKGVTTSIRLESGLSQKLEEAACNLHRGKNWLISEALRSYLDRLENPNLKKEARRQSLLVSEQKDPDEDLWETNSDQEGWSI